MKRLSLCLILLVGSVLPVLAQTLTLSGRVTDAATGKPLPFANVYLNGTTRGTTTDEQGQYSLPGVLLGTVEVVASFLGYETARQSLRVLDAVPKTLAFSLKPSAQQLAGITVRAGRDKVWERQLRQFENQLLGAPFGDQCRIVNRQVINFTELNDHLRATATEPLVIENEALGYQLTYDLQYFDATRQQVYYAGSSRLSERPAASSRQAERYQRNRLTAYLGSTRHLLASLVRGTHEEEGFLIYYVDRSKPMSAGSEPPTLRDATTRYKRLLPIRLDSLIRPARLSGERRLVSQRPLVIFYTKGTSGYSPYRDARHAYSLMELPQGEMLITTAGLVSQPNGMRMQGSLADDRLSTLLPADWKPDQPATASPVAQARPTGDTPLPADAVLTYLRETAANAFTPPALFVHTDKPFYATGDRLWLSAYLLDGATHRPMPGQTALHVDLLDPSGQLVQHQWLRVDDGRAVGDLALPDTLSSGNYQLRAYTDEDRDQRAPAFQRLVTIYNPVRMPPTSPAPPGKPNRSEATSLTLAMGLTPDSSQLSIRLSRGAAPDPDSVYLLVRQRGQLVEGYNLRLRQASLNLLVPLSSLLPGLVQTALYDGEARLLAEQIGWVPDRTAPVAVRVRVNKPQFQPREPVVLDLALSEGGQPVVAALSVSVTDAGQVPADSLAADIRTHLALTGELSRPLAVAGQLDRPAGLAEQTSRRVSSLVAGDTLVGGMTLGGQVLQSGSYQPLAGVAVTIASFDRRQPLLRTVQADAQGRFRLRGLMIQDTLAGRVQFANRERKSMRIGEVFFRLDAPGQYWPAEPSPAAPDWRGLQRYLDAVKARQARRIAQASLAGTAGRSGSGERSLSLHQEADEVISFTEKQTTQYSNLYEMLMGRSSSVQVKPTTGVGEAAGRRGYEVTMRGLNSILSSNSPLFLLDGLPLSGDPQTVLLEITPMIIERIEVLKNTGNSGLYGMRGANGVIAFFTRRNNANAAKAQTSAPIWLVGYPSAPRRFTVPYTEESQPEPGADRRDLLYWKPVAQTDGQGKTQLKFPLSDEVRTIRVNVQGITPDGRPVSGTSLIRVR